MYLALLAILTSALSWGCVQRTEHVSRRSQKQPAEPAVDPSPDLPAQETKAPEPPAPAPAAPKPAEPAAPPAPEPIKALTYVTGKTSAPSPYFAMKIDLRAKESFVIATRSADRKKTVSNFAKVNDCDVAVNANFFDYNGYGVVGLAVGGGEAWQGASDNATMAFIGVDLKGRATFSPATEVLSKMPTNTYAGVSGYPQIVVDGKAPATTDCGPHFCARHPRSGIGLSKDGHTLILAVIDGRTATAKGATTKELGDLMVELGAYQALNLDGGGSTALYVKSEGGIVNHPSDGSERVVANHLGVCKGNADDVARRQKALSSS